MRLKNRFRGTSSFLSYHLTPRPPLLGGEGESRALRLDYINSRKGAKMFIYTASFKLPSRKDNKLYLLVIPAEAGI